MMMTLQVQAARSSRLLPCVTIFADRFKQRQIKSLLQLDTMCGAPKSLARKGFESYAWMAAAREEWLL
jgi:hypothetical protein